MKTVTSGLLIVLLCTCLFWFAVKVQPVKATTITVPDDYPTIQAAINAAIPGDTIYVRNGLYPEHLEINKAVTLEGESNTHTCIEALQGSARTRIADSGVCFTSNDSTLENFNITSSVDGPIVNIDGLDAACSHNTILNNNFASNCNYAEDDILEISGSLSNIVEGNQLVIAPSLVAYGDWAGIIVDFGSDGTVVNNNTVRGGYIGIGVFFADNVTVSNNYVTEQTLNNSPVLPELDGALDIEESSGDLVKGNTLMNNTIGLFLGFDVSNCALYHNNFIDNAQQVSISDLTRVTLNSWDNGYPYGGNYWSDYGGTDFYSGPYQNVTGSDGIGDTPYTIAINNVDDYPLMEPWDSPPTFTASVSVYPNVLNLQSKGTWVTFHIKLPAGYDVADINVSTIMLNSTVPAESTPTSIEDNNSVPDLIVTFNRTELVNFMVSENIIFDNVTLTVAGQLYDGTNFIGTSTIQVSSLMGDINCDGKISLSDLALLVKAYGSHPGDPDWNDNANFVEPYNRICLSDLCTVAVHYGQHEP